MEVNSDQRLIKVVAVFVLVIGLLAALDHASAQTGTGGDPLKGMVMKRSGFIQQPQP